MSWKIYEAISSPLSGLREGAINTIGAIPNAFVRGINVAQNNFKRAVPNDGENLPVIPNLALDKNVLDKEELDNWIPAWEWGKNKRQNPFTGPDAYNYGQPLYYYDNAMAYFGRYPMKVGGAAIGGYVLDQWLNKPVEGLVDTLTFNALNLRPDEKPRQQDVFYPAVPTLTAEDLAYQIKRQQGNMAITALTLQELQRIQQLQSGMPLQTLQPVDYGY